MHQIHFASSSPPAFISMLSFPKHTQLSLPSTSEARKPHNKKKKLASEATSFCSKVNARADLWNNSCNLSQTYENELRAGLVRRGFFGFWGGGVALIVFFYNSCKCSVQNWNYTDATRKKHLLPLQRFTGPKQAFLV